MSVVPMKRIVKPWKDDSYASTDALNAVPMSKNHTSEALVALSLFLFFAFAFLDLFQ